MKKEIWYLLGIITILLVAIYFASNISLSPKEKIKDVEPEEKTVSDTTKRPEPTYDEDLAPTIPLIGKYLSDTGQQAQAFLKEAGYEG